MSTVQAVAGDPENYTALVKVASWIVGAQSRHYGLGGAEGQGHTKPKAPCRGQGRRGQGDVEDGHGEGEERCHSVRQRPGKNMTAKATRGLRC